jgi:type IV pilus assembly protein PilN
MWYSDEEISKMILINLLPHRETVKLKRKESFFVSLGASALLGVLLSGLIFLWFQTQILQQQGRNTILITENQRLDLKIKEVAALQSEISGLRSRQSAVEDLQIERNLPVHLLNEIVKQVPDGVFVKNLKQEASLVVLTGVAQSNERVAELLRNLSIENPYLSKPELIEIVAGTTALTPKDLRRVSNFVMQLQLKNIVDERKNITVARPPITPSSTPSALPAARALKS